MYSRTLRVVFRRWEEPLQFHWSTYRPSQAEQPTASKVLTHHSLPASLDAWSLGQADCKNTRNFANSIEEVLWDCPVMTAEERRNEICKAIWNQPWTPLVREIDPSLTGSKPASPNSNQQSPPREWHCLTTGDILLRQLTRCTQKGQERLSTDRSTLRQRLQAESLSEHRTLRWLWQRPCHVGWHEESLRSKYHQDCTP